MNFGPDFFCPKKTMVPKKFLVIIIWVKKIGVKKLGSKKFSFKKKKTTMAIYDRAVSQNLSMNSLPSNVASIKSCLPATPDLDHQD